MSSEVQRYITGIMTPVEMANPGPASISARQTVVVTYDDYAALEAENARLQSAFDELAERYGKLQTGEDSLLARVVTERDAARAQLAAIQGGMGEAVEVVAVRFSSDGFGSYIADTAMGVPAGYPGDVREPLMTVAQHQRITAAMAAELEQVRAELEAIKGQEPFVWMRPDGDECFELTSEGDYLSFPLYKAPQPGPDVRTLVSADDVRDACANAVSVFAEETNASQCREVAEYMREVLLAQIARRQDQPK